MNQNSTVLKDSLLQPSDYASISDENTRRYGTDIDRIGQILLAERYDDRTHFVYELLQNAEDALGRRNGWNGSRAVSFTLTERALDVRHYGDPFNKDDVRGICGIAEGKKETDSIGRFGIGFKSVYAFTDRPEIHSGVEDFAIKRYVHPYPVPPIEREPEETVILIPLRDSAGFEDIAAGFERLDARSLLFLRLIDQIQWETADGRNGLYHRKTIHESTNARRIVISEQQKDQDKAIENWLVFSQPISNSQSSGVVEIAFQLVNNKDGNGFSIDKVTQSPLVVYFPTVKETHLGFFIQGPYRTTPSRDNVYIDNEWNQHCVSETARLLVSTLNSLRDIGRLDVGVLQALPVHAAHFGEQSMFVEIFQKTKTSLTEQPLLPRFGGGYTSAQRAKLARTEELRQLFDEPTLANLYGLDGDLNWVSADVSRDRTYELWSYLQEELNVEEVTPRTVLTRLNVSFLEARPDEWICRFYEFLNQQQALRVTLKRLPIVRLEDGSHVQAFVNGKPQAYLQGEFKTGFPTVKAGVYRTDEARSFLQTLGLTEPSPVDDVIMNVLPKYNLEEIAVDNTEYEDDILRMLNAFSKGSSRQRETLIASLSETRFIKVKDSLNYCRSYQKPVDVHIPTDRLKRLYNGVTHAFFVDDKVQCLQGKKLHDMLEACGAVHYLRPVRKKPSLSWDEKRTLREQAGQSRIGRHEKIEDWTIHGFEDLLNAQQSKSVEERRTVSKLIWDELTQLADQRRDVFSGEYSWTFYGDHSQSFDSAFVKLLRTTEWIPDNEGNLQRPELILFDSLDWEPNPFLIEKIRFKPPTIDQLAREAGIEPEVIDLLKKYGITSKEELANRLGLEKEPDQSEESILEEAAEKPQSEMHKGTLGRSATGTETTVGESVFSSNREKALSHGRGQGRGSTVNTSKTSSQRTFVSYVAVHPNDKETDPDGLDQSNRMAIENRAINFILEREPDWNRTPEYNPGYDLYKAGLDKQPIVLCEVKAMTQSLAERPVGLTRTQFEYARKYGENYWLYIVEHTNEETPRIVRINDPVGKARTYTFDLGWKDIAHED